MLEKILKLLLILVFLALIGFVIHAVAVKKGYCEQIYFKYPYKQIYSEWAFVHLHKFIGGGAIGGGDRGVCGWYLTDVCRQRPRGNYFSCTTWKELKEKWKDKPKPEGFDEFLNQCPTRSFYEED